MTTALAVFWQPCCREQKADGHDSMRFFLAAQIFSLACAVPYGPGCRQLKIFERLFS